MNAMKGFITIVAICLSCMTMQGQAINIKTVASPKSNYGPRYYQNHPYLDTRYLDESINYYDGQKIVILPSFISDDKSYDYIDGFKTPDGQVYRPQICNNEFVRHYDRSVYPLANGYIEKASGSFTPANELEGHTFTIQSISFAPKKVTRQFDGWSDFVYSKDITISLVDESNHTVIFSCEWYDKGQFPFVFSSYLDEYYTMVGQEYLLKDNYKNRTLARSSVDGLFRPICEPIKITDVGFIQGTETTPFIFFTDKSGIEFYYPTFYTSPSSYGFQSQNESIHWSNQNLYMIDLSYLVSKAEIEQNKKKAEEDRIEAAELSQAAAANRHTIKEDERVNAAMRAVQRRIYLIQKYGEELGTVIASGKIRIGMTKEQCIDAFGKPIDINKTVTANSVSEQWIYKNRDKKTVYVYFENGTLTAFQN